MEKQKTEIELLKEMILILQEMHKDMHKELREIKVRLIDNLN